MKYLNLDDFYQHNNYVFDLNKILDFAATSETFDFKLISSDYEKLYGYYVSNKDFASGRTKDNFPFFSFAGLKFILMTAKEAEKYIILK